MDEFLHSVMLQCVLNSGHASGSIHVILGVRVKVTYALGFNLIPRDLAEI